MVIKNNIGMIHAYAQCEDCDWDAVFGLNAKNRMQKLRRKIRNHVETSGHKVVLETGSVEEFKKSINQK